MVHNGKYIMYPILLFLNTQSHSLTQIFILYRPNEHKEETCERKEKRLVLKNIESRKTKYNNYVVSFTRWYGTDIRREMIKPYECTKAVCLCSKL